MRKLVVESGAEGGKFLQKSVIRMSLRKRITADKQPHSTKQKELCNTANIMKSHLTVLDDSGHAGFRYRCVLKKLKHLVNVPISDHLIPRQR